MNLFRSDKRKTQRLEKSRDFQGKRPPAIQLENVSFSFPDTPVFSHLNFSIEGGLCTCILGPSGCGKSTLLRLVSNSPGYRYSGRIRFSQHSHQDNTIAWMAQKDLLLPWMTVLDNVLLGARLRNQLNKTIREKARSLLVEVGLEGAENKYPAELSGGMRQRAALLRTLMEDRPVILMDEPFSALDALTRIKLQNLTAKLIRGATVLMVTHDPMEALRLGDRVFVISGKPARAGNVIIPPGKIPRDSADPAVVQLNAKLLRELLGESNP